MYEYDIISRDGGFSLIAKGFAKPFEAQFGKSLSEQSARANVTGWLWGNEKNHRKNQHPLSAYAILRKVDDIGNVEWMTIIGDSRPAIYSEKGSLIG